MIRDLNKLIRYLAYVLELLVLFMLQETPGLLPSIFGARPVLLFPAVVAIAMLEPEVPALLFDMCIRDSNNALQEIAGEVDELRRKAAALEKEKKALEERAAGGPQLEALHREVEQLREENQRLRQGMAGAAPDNEALLEELSLIHI